MGNKCFCDHEWKTSIIIQNGHGSLCPLSVFLNPLKLDDPLASRVHTDDPWFSWTKAQQPLIPQTHLLPSHYVFGSNGLYYGCLHYVYSIAALILSIVQVPVFVIESYVYNSLNCLKRLDICTCKMMTAHDDNVRKYIWLSTLTKLRSYIWCNRSTLLNRSGPLQAPNWNFQRPCIFVQHTLLRCDCNFYTCTQCLLCWSRIWIMI